MMSPLVVFAVGKDASRPASAEARPSMSAAAMPNILAMAGLGSACVIKSSLLLCCRWTDEMDDG